MVEYYRGVGKGGRGVTLGCILLVYYINSYDTLCALWHVNELVAAIEV